jgi:hypothetical protein
MSANDELIRQLVDEALGTCEPEFVDETATAYTRSVLERKFAAVLKRNARTPRPAGGAVSETSYATVRKLCEVSNPPDYASKTPNCSFPQCDEGFACERGQALMRVLASIKTGPISKVEILAACDWPAEPFKFFDEPGEHDPCYVCMPGGALLPLNHHGTNGVDQARARFIVDACNAALSTPAASRTVKYDTPDGPRYSEIVDGARVHGDKPLSDAGREAVSDIIEAVRNKLAPPASAGSEGAWTAELESARIDLCKWLVATADDYEQSSEISKRLLEAEQCITLLAHCVAAPTTPANADEAGLREILAQEVEFLECKKFAAKAIRVGLSTDVRAESALSAMRRASQSPAVGDGLAEALEKFNKRDLEDDPPWPQDSDLEGVWQEGVSWALLQVGKFLGIKNWDADGASESIEGDVAHEIGSIFATAKLYDPETGAWASLTPAMPADGGK